MDRTIIRNAIVLSMDSTIGEHLDCDVLIEGTKIVAVQPNLGPVDALEIDGRDSIVMPGFVDTHRHTWQCLLRNTATDWSLAQYFGGVRGVMGELYTPDDMYVANYIGSLEALDAGITTMVDWSHNNNSPDHADMAIKGLRDAGLRAVFGYGNANREWFPISNLPTDFADVARVRKQHFSSDDGLVTMAFAARGPQFATMEQTEIDFRRARALDLPITLHAGDGLWGLDHPIDQLNAKGLLGPRTTYVHCCTLSDHEFKLMAESGGSASLSAEVELNMGHGNPATLGCLKYGLRPSISIDVCTSVGGDMFTQIRVLMAASRGVVNAEALRDRKLLDPVPLTARDMLDFATLQGAKTANLDHRTGSLTPGKDADLIILDTNALNMFPVNNPVGAVVSDAHIGNIDSVFVRGRAVKRHGKLVDVDIKALRRRMESTVEGLFERAGVARDGNWLPKPYVGGTDADVSDID
ncbi:amidohydrolase family protein [Lichenifustis flavocetrariae]|uniref:Amidohydrolase family protein n=1 Tax=Lichenifustis flavocetrariae TaxID=2949735 RepID=A0AA41YYZ7_9HYPH|nr:amidohydrolase family protein [Lichenifustis flavocetrariae]MCW6511181.1 amidohydrolase family protein [Lichenifustis flavocetrariae]